MSVNKLGYDMVCGYEYSLIKNPDKTVDVIGENRNGELGIGNRIAQQHFVKSPLKDIVQIAATDSHSLFLTSDAHVYATGYNLYGQLGIGNDGYMDQIIPVMIPTLDNIIQIATGNSHSLFLTSNGHVYACGNNAYGQLGIGNNIHQYNPVKCDISNIVSIAAGCYNSFLIQYDDKDKSNIVYAAGYNNYGQLGLGNTIDQNSFIKSDIKEVSKIEAGWYHSLFLKNDGTVWGCGSNSNGELGIGNYIKHPTLVKCNIEQVNDISAGWYHSLFLKDDGCVYGAGLNEDGQLGNDNSPEIYTPIKLNVENVAGIKAGAFHSVFLTSDGSIITEIS